MGVFDRFKGKAPPPQATGDGLGTLTEAALGIERKVLDPVEEAAATSQILGWAIVLLKDAPPRGPAAFAEWARGLGLESAGIRVSIDRSLHLGIGKHDALAYVGDGPFPAARLGDLGASADFVPGRGFIGLSLGIPGNVPLFRVAGQAFDPWAMDGQLRDLSRIASELSKHAVAVILPQSGTFFEAETFRAWLGDLDDPNLRPFGAWIGHSVDDSRGIYSTHGMVLQGLPEVSIDVDVNDDWEIDRAREALLVACSIMAHANAELNPGQRLAVPVAQLVGAGPLTPIDGDAEVYVVSRANQDSGGLLHLTRVDQGVRARWAKAFDVKEPGVAFNTYRELLRGAVSRWLGVVEINSLKPKLEGDYPPFEVDVWEARDGSGFYMTTIGIGRVPQRFGSEADGTVRIELVAAMRQHHPIIANAIAIIAAHIHLQKGGSGAFKVGDIVGFEMPEIQAVGFVLGDAGLLSIAEGPKIHMLELIPVSKSECAEARQRGSAGFRARVGKLSPASRADRWKLLLS